MFETDSGISERLTRESAAMRSVSFGIGFLDDALNGILPSDLVIIGARTGAGKTQLSTIIAKEAASKEKKVALIALEAAKGEIVSRIKYQIIANKFFEERHAFPNISLNFTDWLFCKYGAALEPLEKYADKMLPEILENISIYSPNISDFTKKSFELVYEHIAKDCDLVILDHIHYIAPDEKEREFDHIQKTMWKLRDLINKFEVPIVGFSHLRKEDKADNSLVPTIEELHGSSEISKQANHVVAFAPLYKIPGKEKDQVIELPAGSTGCRVLKTRTGHDGASRYVAVLKFNLEKRCYDKTYVPYETDKFARKITPLRVEGLERWMGLARPPKM